MGDLEQSPKDADLLKLEILLGISFRVSRSNLLRSLQGNTGIDHMENPYVPSEIYIEESKQIMGIFSRVML